MDLIREKEVIQQKINSNQEFEGWYFNRNKMIVRSLTNTKKLTSKQIKELEYTDNKVDVFKVDGMTLYSFNFEIDAHIVLAFYEEIDLTMEQKVDLFVYIGTIYTNQVIILSMEQRRIIFDIVKSMSQPEDLESVLNNILDGAITIIDKVNMGYMQLYTEETNTLDVVASIGFSHDVNSFKPVLGESVGGQVYLDGIPRYYNSREEIEADKELWKAAGKNVDYVEKAFRKAYIDGLICVPIVYLDKTLGAITLYKKKEDRVEFSEYDVGMLESFASKAAVSIENTMLINQLKESLEETERINAYVNKKNKIFKDTTQLSLMNRGVQEIAKALSDMLEIDLMLFDKAKNTLEFNNIDKNLSDDEVKELILSYEMEGYKLDDNVYNGYCFFPIKNGNVLLGYLITKKLLPTEKETKRLIEESLLTLNIELMKSYLLDDVTYKRTHEYFSSLINTNDKLEIEEYRKRLALPTNSWYMSVIVGVKEYGDLQLLQMETHNIISSMENEFKDYSKLLYGFHNKVVLILYMEDREDLEKIKNKLANVVKLQKHLNRIDLSIGVGAYYYGIDQLFKTHREADLALSYGLSREDKSVVAYDEIGINRLFINHIPGDIDKFLKDVLSELDSEEAVKSDLKETLFTYIQTNKSAVETSEKLHIHINTFYNRLKKIEKMLDIDFNDPEDNLKIQLACYLNQNRESMS